MIKLIVPFPAGGSVDIVGRVIADAIGSTMKQPIMVENHPGASGAIGSAMVANASPDGYTLLLGIAATHAIQPALAASCLTTRLRICADRPDRRQRLRRLCEGVLADPQHG